MNMRFGAKSLLAAFLCLSVTYGVSLEPATAKPKKKPKHQGVVNCPPGKPTQIGPSGVGHAEASVGTVTSGTVSPSQPGDLSQPMPDKFNEGEQTAEEKTALSRVGITSNPRSDIARYISRVTKPSGFPVMQRGQLRYVNNESLAATFPQKAFYVLRFPQWPLAMNTPEPLGNNNIFVVDRSNGVKLITETPALEAMFRSDVHGITDTSRARHALKSWLALSQELAQDGMFRFSVPDSSITIKPTTGVLTATGKAVVDTNGGNSGDITASIVFNAAGDIIKMNQIVNLQAGMRPICQSTKLLDADPIVRRMAEQDLMIMGLSAKPYLDEQRAKASPELQKAIDEIWEKIVSAGR